MNIPEDLTGLTEDELNALGNEIREAAEALSEEAASSDEALAEVERLVQAFDRVNAELAEREAARTERADRASAALNKLSGAPDSGDSDDAVVEDEADEVVEIAAAIEDAEEAAVEEPVEMTDESVTDEIVEVPETVTAATEPEAVVEATVEAEQITPEDSSTDTQPIEFSTEDAVTTTEATTDAEALASHVPDSMDPVASEPQTGAMLTASNAVPGSTEGTVLDRSALATAITKKRHGMNNASAGSYERIVLATAQADFPHKVTGGAEENFGVFETVRQEWASARRQETALVASGGNCSPIDPSYEFFRLAEELNPVEASLPTVEAPRGGIRFITPPDWADAQAGVRVTTEAQDTAGYGNGSGQVAPKPCVVVDCPPVEECRVDAVSKCVQFGNLNYRVFPEQVEAFLADLSVAFTAEKEVFYLDAIDGASTAVTAAPAYGATRGSTTTLLIAAANYRRRHHMSETATLSLFLPSWFVDLAKADMVNDHSMGLGFLTAGTAEVNAWLASQNLDVTWYYDGATGAGQDFADAQGAGDLNAFPTSVVGYLFAPGTFVRLDGGTLDVGIVRDSTLNGTNDLQIFSEQWVQVCQVGLESLRLEITLCPDGTAPEPVVPLVCDASA